VLALNLQSVGLKPLVLDMDENKIGKYLEGSGLSVHRPNKAQLTETNTIVIAANQSHAPYIKRFYTHSVVDTNQNEIILRSTLGRRRGNEHGTIT
jgi:hypothetical protein